MLDMFWIALELSNPKMGLIIKLSLRLKNKIKIIAFKKDGFVKSGNLALTRYCKKICFTL